ncbi:hypothetical protein D3C73_1489870 [compost metagenome]
MQPALALVGEVQVALCVEDQIIDALEAFAVAPFKIGRDGPGCNVQCHQSVLVIGDEQAAGVQKLHAVGFTVVFGHQ